MSGPLAHSPEEPRRCLPLVLAYLGGTKPFENREENPLPRLLLLDLSMPGKRGLEVLKWIKNTPDLTSLPVVVLSSSNQKRDIHRAHLLGANGFVIKPGDPNQLLHIMTKIQEYWLSDVRPEGDFIHFAPDINLSLPKASPPLNGV